MGLLPIWASAKLTFGTGSPAVPVDSSARVAGGSSVGPLARVQAFFGFGGALLGLVAVLLPHLDQFYVPGLLAVQGTTVLTATWLIAYADRIPMWLVRVMPAFGTLLISASIVFSADATSAYAILYLWVGLYAFYFLPRRDGALHIAFVAINYAVVIALTGTGSLAVGASAGTNQVHHFVITVGTLVVTGILLLYLRGGAERLWRSLVEAARHDLLTGLSNRRGLSEVLHAELERGRLGNRPVSVLVTDLDHFKEVNDRLGQRSGDLLLQRIGKLFDEATRQMDSVGRTGGQEFTVVLPEADEQAAYLVAEQLLARVRRSFQNEPVPLTTSIGVASFPGHAGDVEGLIRAADDALYAAKALGRDRAVLYSAEVPEILAGEVSKREADTQAHLATVLSLAEALDLRESGTASHSQTVGRLAEVIARELGMEEERVKRVRLAGILHDIGKVGVTDAVLKKPGPLDDEEWTQMRSHPEIGGRILGSRELGDIREWVMASHERPDGRGYPRGLTDEEIPLEAKILAVADAYEAMTADRVYRPAIGVRAARAELRRCAGTQFDREVVATFLRALDRQGMGVAA